MADRIMKVIKPTKTKKRQRSEAGASEAALRSEFDVSLDEYRDQSGEISHSPLRINFSFEYMGNEDYAGVCHWNIDIYLNDKDILIGKMLAWTLNFNQNNAFEALDSAGETAKFLELLDENEEISDKTLFIAESSDDLYRMTILDRLEILPEYRGYGLTKFVFEAVENSIGIDSIIALIAYPIQFEGKKNPTAVFGEEWKSKMDYKQLCRNERKAKKSLTAFYERLGYEKVPGCKENILVRRLEI